MEKWLKSRSHCSVKESVKYSLSNANILKNSESHTDMTTFIFQKKDRGNCDERGFKSSSTQSGKTR